MQMSSFKKSGHMPTLFSAFMYFGISSMIWALLSSLGVTIAEDFHLSPAQKGLLVALPILGGAFLRLVFGALTDRIGAKKTTMIGLTLTFVPLLWGWLGARSLGELQVVALLLGVAGASFAVALPMASRWFPPEHQGLAMGIVGAGNGGTVLTALFALRIAKHFGGNWHSVFAVAIIPIAITWLIVALLAKESPNRPAPKGLSDYLSILREPDTLWFSLFYSITFGGFIGLASFMPTFYHDQYGVPKILAGNYAAICIFAGSFVRPIGGYLADRFGGVRMLIGLYCVIGLLAFASARLFPLSIEIPLLFVLMASLGLGNGAVFQLVPQRFPRHIGVVTGIVGAAGGLGGFALPFALGYFKQTMGSFGTGLTGFALGAAFCIALVVVLHPLWNRAGWLGAGGRALAVAAD